MQLVEGGEVAADRVRDAEGFQSGLEALRDRLATAIDNCDSGRDLAALSRQYVDVTERLEHIAPAEREGTGLDEFTRALRVKRGSGTAATG